MAVTGQQKARAGVPARTGQPGSGPPGSGGLLKMPPRRTWLWFVAILIANFLILRVLNPGAEPPLHLLDPAGRLAP